MPKEPKTMRVWVTRDSSTNMCCVFYRKPRYKASRYGGGCWDTDDNDAPFAEICPKILKKLGSPVPKTGGPSSIIECEIPVPCFRVVKRKASRYEKGVKE